MNEKEKNDVAIQRIFDQDSPNKINWLSVQNWENLLKEKWNIVNE